MARPWNPLEKGRLKELVKQGLDRTEVKRIACQELGKSERSVEAMMFRLKLKCSKTSFRKIINLVKGAWKKGKSDQDIANMINLKFGWEVTKATVWRARRFLGLPCGIDLSERGRIGALWANYLRGANVKVLQDDPERPERPEGHRRYSNKVRSNKSSGTVMPQDNDNHQQEGQEAEDTEHLLQDAGRSHKKVKGSADSRGSVRDGKSSRVQSGAKDKTGRRTHPKPRLMVRPDSIFRKIGP